MVCTFLLALLEGQQKKDLVRRLLTSVEWKHVDSHLQALKFVLSLADEHPGRVKRRARTALEEEVERMRKQVDVLGELVEIGGAALVHLLHALHVLVQAAQLRGRVVVEQLRELGLPGVAVRHERLLQRRAVYPDEAHVGDALLRLDVLLQLLVPRDVRLEGGERAVGLGVAAHEGVLVHVPDVLVLACGIGYPFTNKPRSMTPFVFSQYPTK